MKTDKQFDMNISEPNVEFLASTERRTGMTLPEGFFADFDKRMEAAIDAEEQKKLTVPASTKEQVVEIGNTRRPLWIAVAACLLVAVCVLPFMRSLNTDTTSDAADIAALAVDAMDDEQEDYLLTSISDYEMYDYYCEAM